MESIRTESTFEHAIEEHLLEHGGCARGNSADFDPALALDAKTPGAPCRIRRRPI